MSAPSPRPRFLTAAFWCWLVGAVLLMVGGMIAASISSDVPGVIRGAGVVTVLAGGAMAFLAGRSRGDDPRYRRAAVALALAIVVLVALLSVFGWVALPSVLAMIPLIAGSALVTRPGVAARQEDA